jgi:hypothetical protein
VLAYRGWFCEIGKRDIYANSKIGMYALRKGITITAVDTDTFAETHPDLVVEMMSLVVGLITEGKIAPIPTEEYHPTKCFGVIFRDTRDILYATILQAFARCSKRNIRERLFSALGSVRKFCFSFSSFLFILKIRYSFSCSSC